MSLVIGLTGGIVSGKSTVAEMFQLLGATIIDADRIGHEVILPYKPAWHKLIKTFGKSILQKDMKIDRKKLGYIVFNNKRLLEKLNEATHPEIEKILKNKIKVFREGNHLSNKIILIDAPLIYEAGIENLMDKIILVNLKEEEQIKRLTKRNGLNREESLKRIKSQIPNKEKAKKADYIINNNLSFENTKKQVEKVWQELIRLNECNCKKIHNH